MEFDPSRRLFLRRAGLSAVAPVVAPVLPLEKIVKYFFAPNGGWGISRMVTLGKISGIPLAWDSYERLVKMEGSSVRIRMPQRWLVTAQTRAESH
jgi:hypothetical protein